MTDGETTGGSAGSLRRSVRSLLGRHGPTALLVELLVLVYVLEYWVATAVGEEAYEWLFVATIEPSPGWLLAPFAHDLGDPFHLLSSAVAIVMFGPLVEAALSRRRYVGFCLAAAYVSLGAQVATYAVGDPRGTLGASGIAMAVIAFVAVDVGRRWAGPGAEVERAEAGFAVVGWVLLVRQLERDFGVFAPAVAQSALVGHVAGTAFGLLCGLLLAARE